MKIPTPLSSPRNSFARALCCAALLGGSIGTSAPGAIATKYSIELQNVQQQTGDSTVIGGYSALGYNQYSLVGKIDTGGASLSATPFITLSGPTASYPSGIVTFPSATPNWASAAGYNRYQYGNAWTTLPDFTANAGSGTFTFTLGDATATPTLSLDTATPTLPPTPLLTGGGTWSGSSLLVDAGVANTFYFNSSAFTTYSTGLGGAVSFTLFSAAAYPTPYTAQSISQYDGVTHFDPALDSLSLAAGTLVAGQNYILQINYSQLLATNATSFTGTGITGTPQGLSYDTTTTFVNIQAIPEPAEATLTAGLVTAGLACLWRWRQRKPVRT